MMELNFNLMAKESSKDDILNFYNSDGQGFEIPLNEKGDPVVGLNEVPKCF